jgi:hypothetical protein
MDELPKLYEREEIKKIIPIIIKIKPDSKFLFF